MNPRNTLLVRAIIVAVIALPFCASSPAIAQDCNNNGIPDLQDIDPADPDGDGEVSADCNGNGVPDECEPDCNGNGIIDDCDLPSFFRKLTPSDAATGDGFGDAVAIDGNRIVVGASYDDDGGIDSGAAYIFQNIDGQWTEIAKLTADDATAGDLFGAAVTISGDTVAISATGDVGDGNDPGSVYVFGETDGIWQQVARLTPSDAAPGRRFGFSISIDGDTLAVGEPFGNNGITGTGAIYVFRRISGAWQEMTKLTPQPYQPVV